MNNQFPYNRVPTPDRQESILKTTRPMMAGCMVMPGGTGTSFVTQSPSYASGGSAVEMHLCKITALLDGFYTVGVYDNGKDAPSTGTAKLSFLNLFAALAADDTTVPVGTWLLAQYIPQNFTPIRSV